MTIPTTSVGRENSKASCVVVEDGKARRQTVGLGLEEGGRVEILSGLELDEHVAKVYTASQADGQPVTMVELEPAKHKS